MKKSEILDEYKKQWELDWGKSFPSKHWTDVGEASRSSSLEFRGISDYISSGTGTISSYSNELTFSDEQLDKLMGRLMTHTSKVIVPCRFCGSHNAFSNPCCAQCGAPMGK